MRPILRLIGSAFDVLSDPTGNLTAAVLLPAGIILSLLIVIMGLLLVVTRHRGSKDRVDEYDDEEYEEGFEPAEAETDAPAADRGPGWLPGGFGTALILLIAAVGVVWGYVGTSGDEFCRKACHADQPKIVSYGKGVHRKVSCVSCHEDAAPGGFAGGLVLRATHLVENSVRSIRAYAEPVASRRCLSCHREILSRTMTSKIGVRISHREPLEAGLHCSDCHSDVGHASARVRMGKAQCVRCHDGKRASAKCTYCHAADPAKTTHASDRANEGRLFSRIRLGSVDDCSGCHTLTKCDACHGISMPHDDEFKRWGHARYAAFDGKNKICYRCHSKNECRACHRPFTSHPGDWKNEHKQSTPSAYCGCHWPRLPADGKELGSWCAVCHRTS